MVGGGGDRDRDREGRGMGGKRKREGGGGEGEREQKKLRLEEGGGGGGGGGERRDRHDDGRHRGGASRSSSELAEEGKRGRRYEGQGGRKRVHSRSPEGTGRHAPRSSRERRQRESSVCNSQSGSESESAMEEELRLTWANLHRLLVPPPPPPAPPHRPSALDRFSPSAVLSRTSVSPSLAGPMLYERVQRTLEDAGQRVKQAWYMYFAEVPHTLAKIAICCCIFHFWLLVPGPSSQFLHYIL